ncbi:MAG: hypothetical protein IJ416_05900 [Ruminiclostridium sp.]|nr:hypothetical protein [Ruminiclostridium sp.]
MIKTGAVQPIRGIPITVEGEVYRAHRAPVEVCKVSDNESYAIYEGYDSDGVKHRAKLTVITEGTGDIRTNITAMLEEVAI